MTHEQDRRTVQLPVRPFLYTRDQIASMLAMTDDAVHQRIAYYEGRSVHRRTPDDLLFLNIARDGEARIWRCEETELVRWMRRKKIRVYDTSWARKGGR